MCNLLRCLKGELEGFWSRGFPIFDRRGVWNPVEGVIDFNAVQSARVIPEKLLFGNVRWIEDRLPFLIAETGGTEPNPCHSGIIAHCVPRTPVIIEWNDIGKKKCAKTGRF